MKKKHITFLLVLILLLACAAPGILAGLEALPDAPQETEPTITALDDPEDPDDPKDPEDPDADAKNEKDPGGRPGFLSMTGADFGAMISELAHSEPGAVAAFMHEQNTLRKALKNEGEKAGNTPNGNPMNHQMSGSEFGTAVRDMAHSAPGAVAAHVHEMKRDKKNKTAVEPEADDPGDDVSEGGDAPEGEPAE